MRLHDLFDLSGRIASAQGFVADHPDAPGIAPGYFPSRMAEVKLALWPDRLIMNTPLRKLGGPDDLQGLALLLASDAGGHITGPTIVVDGSAVII